jgi:hypothetical protein
MSRAQIGFKCVDVIRGVGFLLVTISFAAAGAVFFVHPGDYANGSFRMQAELLAEIRNLHGDGNTSGIINCAGAKIPGIQMAADDYNLFGMLRTFQVGDYVEAWHVIKSLRREDEMHGDAALLGEVGDELRVFGGDGRCGNSGGDAVSGVRKTVVGVTEAAYE